VKAPEGNLIVQVSKCVWVSFSKFYLRRDKTVVKRYFVIYLNLIIFEVKADSPIMFHLINGQYFAVFKLRMVHKAPI